MPVLYIIGGPCQGALVYFIFIFHLPQIRGSARTNPLDRAAPFKNRPILGPLIFHARKCDTNRSRVL